MVKTLETARVNRFQNVVLNYIFFSKMISVKNYLVKENGKYMRTNR